jgi:hypothetical protein
MHWPWLKLYFGSILTCVWASLLLITLFECCKCPQNSNIKPLRDLISHDNLRRSQPLGLLRSFCARAATATCRLALVTVDHWKKWRTLGEKKGSELEYLSSIDFNELLRLSALWRILFTYGTEGYPLDLKVKVSLLRMLLSTVSHWVRGCLMGHKYYGVSRARNLGSCLGWSCIGFYLLERSPTGM